MSGLVAPFRDALRTIGYGLRFCGRRILVHPGAWVSRRCVISVRGGGSVVIGRGCELHPMTMVLAYGGDIEIGEDCSLNPFSIVYGHGGVRMGNGVRIAAHAVLIPANHTTPADGTPVRLAPITARGIDIGDDVWIGAGARILDGVRIGARAVVGAGSVVTRDVAAGATVAGVPAREFTTR